MKRKSVSALVAGVVVSLMLVSFGTGAAGAAGTSAQGKPDQSATLSIGYSSPFQGWDPHLITGFAAALAYLTPAYDTLLQYTGANMTLGPMLATKWSYKNPTTLIMQLRSDVNFWDGSHFNATVAAANIMRAKRLLGAGSGASPSSVTSVNVLGPYTIQVNLSAPDPLILNDFAAWGGAMVSPKVVSSNNINATPAGSGPYIPDLSASTPTKFVYNANPHYWNPSAVHEAHLDIYTITDEPTAINAFRAGNIDLTEVTMLSYPQISALAKADPTVKIAAYRSLSSQVVGLNPKANPQLASPNVRKALSLAIDRSSISNQLYSGQCTPTTQLYAPGVPGYIPSLDSAAAIKQSYNPTTAKALLAKSGQSAISFPIENPAGLEPYSSLSTAVQGQLAQVGVKMTINDVSPSAATGIFSLGKSPAVMTLFNEFPSASPPAQYDIRTGNSGNVPPEVTALAAKAAPLPQNGAEATSLYQQINKLLAADGNVIPICRASTFILYRSNVTGANDLPFINTEQQYDVRPLGVTKNPA